MNLELCHASKPWLCHSSIEYGPPHVHPREEPAKSKQASGLGLARKTRPCGEDEFSISTGSSKWTFSIVLGD
jgi:hypothetical protein